MIHSALNYASPSTLSSTLIFLSQYPIFPQLFVNCLRKQEKTTWPKAIHNPNDILYLFRLFLNRGNIEFATSIISILQGVDCVTSETFLHQPSTIPNKLYHWCDIKTIYKQAHPTRIYLVDVIRWLWDGSKDGKRGELQDDHECVAHKASVELLMMIVLRNQTMNISDIYRFIVMEENRHEELQCPIPSAFKIDRLLSILFYTALDKGDFAFAMKLHYEVEFSILPLPELPSTTVVNFAEKIIHIVKNLQLPLFSIECLEEAERMRKAIRECRCSLF